MVTVLVGWKEGFRSALAWLCAAPARTKVATRAAVRTHCSVPVPSGTSGPRDGRFNAQNASSGPRVRAGAAAFDEMAGRQNDDLSFGECGPEATRDWRITMPSGGDLFLLANRPGYWRPEKFCCDEPDRRFALARKWLMIGKFLHSERKSLK